MHFHQTNLKDARLIELEPHGDKRGFFARTMCRAEFERHGLLSDFVQQNTSFSAQRGTLRGLHYQRQPHAEAKLVRCIRGAIVDVIVDIRKDSETYLHHQLFELTDANRRQLYVPPGFAHSFQTLTDDVEVSYLVSAAYHPEAESGLRYNDERLAIEWPMPPTVVSEKDASWPLISERNEALF
ncbi:MULTISPECIES: dTDP-4-dehydrorhamnose 3,5-epimerase [Halomonadaceae]|jgi:dTDP-4-dehydrorhamnose 3,5-epimerase|uniref:dTDP-4-dehydrorhamnose 3,5-epimerase n=1 Tax=Halomonadaceae TaxID=28256 RepID=UPI0012F19645|nr:MULTISPECIES: dTDP-4-dehydrorhamnose 3,5-epimerase [Halomonas]CAD5269616.1 dTDP-4-dehydrorhamnose 3,5-epimerase [Halomonas sp. 156]CAD5281106.1 dTDP-4-dehydrorhamnose 3,5-epimerase [Halomonas sp. 113]CAD5282546.1 dTDP-4-dehydrorhamnose 3,5-epimerase [Halomonas sp. 59]CAD5288662.1 dTDP-4-dehydrorhamnose 3,5-epimerase [Halomonas sp. I3]VXB14822.1 dTDP-4-dehydrorhamnose 3,5-epimerase [Halomonas titanicae]